MGKKKPDWRFSDKARLYITDEAKAIIWAIRKKFYDKEESEARNRVKKKGFREKGEEKGARR